MDNIKNMRKLEQATRFNRADFIKLGLAILFVLAAAAVALYSASAFGGDSRMSGLSVLIVATMVGGYMAMNIGANDVANNVG
ncbi:MAG: inorganic phosphate transporter, partial [Helicobacter sp.]|nr:inorganic phosphate transporter [Helicobacter sp.]